MQLYSPRAEVRGARNANFTSPFFLVISTGLFFNPELNNKVATVKDTTLPFAFVNSYS